MAPAQQTTDPSYNGMYSSGNSKQHIGNVNGSVNHGKVDGGMNNTTNNNYERQKKSMFSNLTRQERGVKLHDFAYTGEIYLLKKLLEEEDIDLEFRGPKGNTALHRAIQTQNSECARLLIKSAAVVNARGEGGDTPLILSTEYGDHELAKLLLESGADMKAKNDKGMNALLIASRDRQLFIVKDLLQNRAEVDTKDSSGWTPLIHAAWKGHFFVVQELLGSSARPEEETEDGWTALMVAAGNGHKDIVRELLQYNPKIHINKAGRQGRTALMWAARRGHFEVAEILAKDGADLKKKDKEGLRADDIAEENGHNNLAKLLRRRRIGG